MRLFVCLETLLLRIPFARFEIEELFKVTEHAFTILCVFAPDDKKKEMEAHVVTLRYKDVRITLRWWLKNKPNFIMTIKYRTPN